MIQIAGILTLIAALVVVMTYNGIFKDKNKNGIPDTWEDKFKEVKKTVKRKKKKDEKS
jgi:Tfp pilus assembly protein PilO